MNNDNTLMIEALIQSRKPKKVLSEGDEEFEDDYFSPGISLFFSSDNRYKVVFSPEPANPKGIITFEKGSFINHKWTLAPGTVSHKYSKTKFYRHARLRNGHRLSDVEQQPFYGAFIQSTATWMFNWYWYNGEVDHPEAAEAKAKIKAEGFIEGEDFIFVKFVKKEE